jgi:hypothetical protein
MLRNSIALQSTLKRSLLAAKPIAFRPYQLRSFATKNDDAPPPKTAQELFEE